jgi:Leucine-rich repeat (LRR) protein
VSLSNASQLRLLYFAQNGLTGTVPQNLASLQGLVRINFDQNRLRNGKDGDLNFLSFLSNCTSLEVLGLAQNNFGGVLPSSIANLSTQLNILSMGVNMIRGVWIGNLVNLNLLGLEDNHLGGPLPVVLGKLQNLEGLELNGNEFSGLIPSSLGNLTRLTSLSLDENRFEGSIPPSLGNCKYLLSLYLSNNNLHGTILKQVIGLSSLSISLVMSHNFLIGAIKEEEAQSSSAMLLHLCFWS